MLKILDPEHFAKAAAFAEAKGPATWRHFWENVFRMHCYADFSGEPNTSAALACVHEGQRAFPSEWVGITLGEKTFTISPDHYTPASWYFTAQTVFGPMGGGIVYHGEQSGWTMPDGTVIRVGEGVATYSVRFGDTSDDPWSWHS